MENQLTNRNKRKNEKQNNQKEKYEMVVVNPYISITTLSINELTYQSKHKVVAPRWLKSSEHLTLD